MLAEATELKVSPESAAEIRRALQRVVNSQTFGRSEQLRRLLLHLCEQTLAGQESSLHEQQIGVDVFGRPSDYDPGIDGIVRTHATRLRQRLEHYFGSEGSQDRVHMEIPRGRYVPRFLLQSPAQEESVPPSPPAKPQFVEPRVEARLSPAPQVGERRLERRSNKSTAILAFLAGVLLAALAVGLVAHLRNDEALRVGADGADQTQVERQFWSSLFNANQRTRVIIGDSGLVMYETFAGREISLGDYLHGRYREEDSLGEGAANARRDQIVSNLASRRYTSEADLRLAVALAKLPGWNPSRDELMFARDLRPSDATTSNLVLLGSRQADPWLAIIEPKLNFMLRPNPAGGFFYLNQAPRPGEMQRYEARQAAGDQHAATTYGHVAYLPNPSGKGMVLVLEGLWMSGTEAAGHFVMTGNGFSEWLRSVQRPDGSIPPFEILLESKALDSSAEEVHVVARRVQP